MEPGLKILVGLVAYVLVTFFICMFFKVGCYGDTSDEDFESVKPEVPEFDENKFHSEGHIDV